MEIKISKKKYLFICNDDKTIIFKNPKILEKYSKLIADYVIDNKGKDEWNKISVPFSSQNFSAFLNILNIPWFIRPVKSFKETCSLISSYREFVNIIDYIGIENSNKWHCELVLRFFQFGFIFRGEEILFPCKKIIKQSIKYLIINSIAKMDHIRYQEGYKNILLPLIQKKFIEDLHGNRIKYFIEDLHGDRMKYFIEDLHGNLDKHITNLVIEIFEYYKNLV